MTEQRKNTVKQTDEHGNVIEVYETEIEQALDQYIAERPDIKSMNEEPQSRWNACLRYINKTVFKGTDKLKEKPYQETNTTFGLTNNNKYNIDIVYEIMLKYIDLCFEYGKEVSVIGFSYLTGIEQQTLYNWANSSIYAGNTTSKGFEIYKTLTETREESLSDRLYSNKANPVGILGILNHHFGWNMGQPHGNTGTQQQSIEQIQEKYRGLPDNSTDPNPPSKEQYAPTSTPIPSGYPPTEKDPPVGTIPPTKEKTPPTDSDPPQD